MLYPSRLATGPTRSLGLCNTAIFMTGSYLQKNFPSFNFVSNGSPSSRPISILVQATTFNKNGKVVNPGHAQFATSGTEQRNHHLPPAIGHGPVPIGQRSSENTRYFPVVGVLPDGKEFAVTGTVTQPRLPGDDPLLQGKVLQFDLPELTDQEAEKLRALLDRPLFPIYETSGVMGQNCVHALVAIARDVFDVNVLLHPHELPQNAAKQVADAICNKTGRQAVNQDLPHD